MRKLIIPLTTALLLLFSFPLLAQELTEKGGFSFDASEEHYYLFILSNERPNDLPELRGEITKYIWKYHANDKLKITQIKVGGELESLPLIHLQSFPDKAAAMAFHNNLKKNRPDFLQMGMTVDYYPLSKRNYEKVLRSKSLKGYKPFFLHNYR
jgi:hypothetical protein